LEFSPLSTSDLIRYLRIGVQAQILAPTTITFGGSYLQFGTVPAQNVTPGLLQLGLGALTTVAGVLTITVPSPGYNSNIVTIDGGGILNGIATAGLSAGCILYLTFVAPVHLKNGATGLASGISPLMLQFNGTTPIDIKWAALAGALSVTLQLLPVGAGGALVWKLIGGPSA
jgi:hypothetical protein